MVKRKKIRLAPTNHYVDCYIYDNQNDLAEVHQLLHKRYGESVEYYEGIILRSCVGIMNFGKNDIILMVALRNPWVIAHEAVHVTWKLGSIIGFENKEDNQEIQAYYVSYIMEQLDPLWNRT